MREIFHLGPNEGDLPTGQCVLGTIGFHLSMVHVEASNKSIQPRLNLSDGRTGFSSAAPVTQEIESLK